MSFPKYEEYRDSGVAWLGEVPSHWGVVPFRHVIDKIESGTSVNSTDTPATNDELGVLKTSCVFSGKFDADENKAVVPEEYERVSCPVRHNALIVSRMNTPELVGAAGLVREYRERLYLPDRLWQISFLETSPTYAHYWTLTPFYRAQVQAACSGTSSSMQNLSQLQFRCFVFPTPPLPEQTAIATFLDRETAKIDELVAEQEKLIELLKEKRQAVISHAVTKGLNPDTPMKDSGIEWLGEVPEHWEILSLKRFWSVIDCKHVTAEFVDEGIPLASIREVQERYVNLTEAKQTTPDFYELMIDGGREPQPGDLIFSRNATVGEVAQVADWHPPFAMGQDVCLLRKQDSTVSTDFLQTVLKSNFVQTQLAGLLIGSTFKRINVEEIKNLTIPAPPSDEQATIFAKISELASNMDTLIYESQRAIDLLKERRSALISAAVTGKIDVRHLATNTKEAA